MSDEQLELTLKETSRICSICDSSRPPSVWKRPAKSSKAKRDIARIKRFCASDSWPRHKTRRGSKDND